MTFAPRQLSVAVALAAVLVVTVTSFRAEAEGKGSNRGLTTLLGQIKSGTINVRWRPGQQQVREAACTVDRRHRLMTNFRWGFSEFGKPDDWQPRFRNTAVPTGGVKEAYLVFEPFEPKWAAAHTMLAFKFENGREVVAQSGATSKGLCVSTEARLKRGQSYGLLDGMRNKYGMVHTLSSWEDMRQKVCGKDQLRLVTYKLNLDQGQRDALLKRALDAATNPVPGQRYHTLRRSCYTSVLSLVNSVVPKRKRVRRWWIPEVLPNPFATLPSLAPRALAGKGLIDRASRRLVEPRGFHKSGGPNRPDRISVPVRAPAR